MTWVLMGYACQGIRRRNVGDVELRLWVLACVSIKNRVGVGSEREKERDPGRQTGRNGVRTSKGGKEREGARERESDSQREDWG